MSLCRFFEIRGSRSEIRPRVAPRAEYCTSFSRASRKEARPEKKEGPTRASFWAGANGPYRGGPEFGIGIPAPEPFVRCGAGLEFGGAGRCGGMPPLAFAQNAAPLRANSRKLLCSTPLSAREGHKNTAAPTGAHVR